MSYYTSLGGSRRSSGGGTAAANRQLAAAAGITATQAKALQAEQLTEALTRILDLPKAEFATASRPVAPDLPAIDATLIRRRHLAEARARTSVFRRAERKAAVAEAAQRAAAEVEAIHQHYRQQHAQWKQLLDERWRALHRNDSDTVLASLTEAFEDNEAAAAAVGVTGSEVSLVVVVPTPGMLPERRPTTTAAGNLSLKKLTKRESADLYKLVVSGHILVTLKECFAVAPAVASARIVALRAGTPDAYGQRRPEVVMAGRVERDRLQGIRWYAADAAAILDDCSSELLAAQKGLSKELQPLDLAEEPELAELVAAIDIEDMLHDEPVQP